MMMALYVYKDKQFVALTREQVAKIKRTDEIRSLQVSARHLSITTRALASWLRGVNKRGRMDATDLQVTKIPNIEHLLACCEELDRRSARMNEPPIKRVTL